MDRNTRDVSSDSKAMLLFFGWSKFSVWEYNTYDVPTGQTFVVNWSKIQLLWVLMLYYPYKMMFSVYKSVLMLYYPYKMMFSVYKSVIVTLCACNLFVSKVTKITRNMVVCFWWSFVGAFFSVWWLSWNQPQPGCWNYLYYIFIHSCTYTTFQIKIIFNNVLFSTEVHNPLHAHLLALSHIYIYSMLERLDYFERLNYNFIFYYGMLERDRCDFRLS